MLPSPGVFCRVSYEASSRSFVFASNQGQQSKSRLNAKETEMGFYGKIGMNNGIIVGYGNLYTVEVNFLNLTTYETSENIALNTERSVECSIDRIRNHIHVNACYELVNSCIEKLVLALELSELPLMQVLKVRILGSASLQGCAVIAECSRICCSHCAWFCGDECKALFRLWCSVLR